MSRSNRGEQAIQCHNGLGNRHDSWFTELLYVSRVLNNVLYHHGKYKLGLSSHLMGNGMCFTSGLLEEMGWTAFTAGEDWEYYTTLIEKGHKVTFALKAVVRHQESKSLEQATSQRLRWAQGPLPDRQDRGPEAPSHRSETKERAHGRCVPSLYFPELFPTREPRLPGVFPLLSFARIRPQAPSHLRERRPVPLPAGSLRFRHAPGGLFFPHPARPSPRAGILLLEVGHRLSQRHGHLPGRQMGAHAAARPRRSSRLAAGRP